MAADKAASALIDSSMTQMRCPSMVISGPYRWM
jgi:hypothetical protein